MTPTNGHDLEATNTERLVALVARLNDSLRDLHAERLSCSQGLARVESGLEDVRKDVRDLRDLALGIQHNVDETRDEVEEFRKDQTDPRFRLQVPTEMQPQKKDGSGPSFAISDKPKLHLPAAWAVWMLKLALSAGFGGALLRLAQWVANKH